MPVDRQDAVAPPQPSRSAGPPFCTRPTDVSQGSRPTDQHARPRPGSRLQRQDDAGAVALDCTATAAAGTLRASPLRHGHHASSMSSPVLRPACPSTAQDAVAHREAGRRRRRASGHPAHARDGDDLQAAGPGTGPCRSRRRAARLNSGPATKTSRRCQAGLLSKWRCWRDVVVPAAPPRRCPPPCRAGTCAPAGCRCPGSPPSRPRRPSSRSRRTG